MTFKEVTEKICHGAYRDKFACVRIGYPSPLPEWHIQNENKTVKWNREYVRRFNERREQISTRNNWAENAESRLFEIEMHQAIMDEYHMTEKQASLIAAKAYERAHSDGFNATLNEARNICEFYQELSQAATQAPETKPSANEPPELWLYTTESGELRKTIALADIPAPALRLYQDHLENREENLLHYFIAKLTYPDASEEFGIAYSFCFTDRNVALKFAERMQQLHMYGIEIVTNINAPVAYVFLFVKENLCGILVQNNAYARPYKRGLEIVWECDKELQQESADKS